MGDSSTGWIGIDPGITGAIGFRFPDGSAAVFDPPVMLVPVGGRRRSQLVEPSAAKLIRAQMSYRGAGPGAAWVDWRAAIEWAQAMPILRGRKDGDPEMLAHQGVVSAFNYGTGFGVWLGILATLEIPVIKIRPQAWKKIMLAGYATKDKDAARAVASGLYPSIDLGRRKDAGRAEALLILEAGRRMQNGVSDV